MADHINDGSQPLKAAESMGWPRPPQGRALRRPRAEAGMCAARAQDGGAPEEEPDLARPWVSEIVSAAQGAGRRPMESSWLPAQTAPQSHAPGHS